ncbi:glycosyltransferase [Clostridium sp. CX1]|uniref:glycosyltransferase n=1 Tax=Clostridium sp. CX1 TaxID=2978346 RepID=UPI0021BDF282|nr:glycosyltransferase [Clostridium sp. CX1]MCT8975969.1 glycosyltransferase [Clostridium sp. CX1]
MKVLHVLSTDKLSGAEKVALDICKNLNQRKFEPLCVCTGELREYFTEGNIKVFNIDVSRLKISELLKLRTIILSENIEIVHAHDNKASIISKLVTIGTNVRIISHIHAKYEWVKSINLMRTIDSTFRNKYDLSIACSKSTYYYYLKYNSNVKNITYLNNSINLEELSRFCFVDKNYLADSYSIPKNKYIFGYIGRLISLKGVDLLIEAFYEFCKENNEGILIITGDGDEIDNLRSLSDSLGIADKVIFTGFKKNVYDYLNLFDCFIISSVSEGLPISLLEAMALEKIIISTPIEGAMEVIENNYNGIILKERTKYELLKMMKYVYENNSVLNNLGINARKTIENGYSMNNYIKNIEEIYTKIIGIKGE